MMVLVILSHVEINTTIAFVSITIVHNLLHQLLLFYDMPRCMRLNTWRQNIQCMHSIVITIGIILCNLHWFELLKPCLLLNLIIPLIGIMLQVPHVSDVTNITNLIPDMFQIAE